LKGVARRGDAVRNERGAARSLNFQTRSLRFKSERDFPLLNAPQCVGVCVLICTSTECVVWIYFVFLFFGAREEAECRDLFVNGLLSLIPENYTLSP